MLSPWAAGQALLVGAILVVAALLKARDTVRGSTRPEAALETLLGKRLGFRAWILTSLLEGALGAELLSTTNVEIGAALAATFFAGATVALLVARRRNPEASCGCFSAGNATPINRLALARSAALGVAAVGAALSGRDSWLDAFAHPVAIALLVVEAAAVVTVTPELRPRWEPERAEWRRNRTLRRSVRAVKRSAPFRRVRRVIPDPRPADVWLDAEEQQHVVLFALPESEPGNERFLAFAVATGSTNVSHMGELRLNATVDGWRVAHQSRDVEKAAGEHGEQLPIYHEGPAAHTAR